MGRETAENSPQIGILDPKLYLMKKEVMSQKYDVIILGTGLKECIISGLFAVKGKKVLHLDRNAYYGAETASLNLTQLWDHFRPTDEQVGREKYGHDRDWNVDLIPKFIIANGKLVKMLLYTKVNHYLEWKAIDASYVAQHQKAGIFGGGAKMAICKVPDNGVDALKSSLMGLFEKRRVISFYRYLAAIDLEDEATWKGVDLKALSMRELYQQYGLEEATIDFLGHAVALYTDDRYLDEPAFPCVAKMVLYWDSVGRFGGNSPFLYPLYGLGGLPEAFSRLCSLHGGTFMLDTPVDEILFGEDGKVTGIRSGDLTAEAPLVICGPSYTSPERRQATGKAIRAICLLDHPIPNTKSAQSIQIILPAKQLKKKTDTYITMVSQTHQICEPGLYVAIVSATVET